MLIILPLTRMMSIVLPVLRSLADPAALPNDKWQNIIFHCGNYFRTIFVGVVAVRRLQRLNILLLIK